MLAVVASSASSILIHHVEVPHARPIGESRAASRLVDPDWPATSPFAPADLSYGASWNLWNNIWGTNYPQWYPFDPKDSNIEYRFSVKYDA